MEVWTIREAGNAWEIINESTKEVIAVVYSYENARMFAASKDLLPAIEEAYLDTKDIPEEKATNDGSEEDEIRKERIAQRKRKIENVRNVIQKARSDGKEPQR